MKCAATILAGALTFTATHATDTGATGGGEPIGTMQPSLVLHCGFAWSGIFPSPDVCGAGSGRTLAEIRMFAGSFVPAGYYPAEGQILPISQNTALFMLLSTTYGGDGRASFGLPDLRGRAIAGTGGRPGLTTRALGEKFGSETVTLGLPGLPPHVHTGPGGSTGLTGGGSPVSTLQPTIALQPLICPYYAASPAYAPEIRLFAGMIQPGVPCDGRLLSIADYPDLFAALGTHYGGDGVVAFAIPDLRSEVAVGAGAGPGLPSRFLGEYVGVEAAPLTQLELASHAHAMASGSTGSSGSGLAFENHQPTLAIRFAIAISGAFPDPNTPSDLESPTIGEIRPFAGNGPLPPEWMYAEGQLLQIQHYTPLFSVIWNTFGGNGFSTFALPDLRGRTPICSGEGLGLTPRVRGEVMGTPTTTLSVAQLAPHTHVLDPFNTRSPWEPSGLRLGKNALDPTRIDLTWGVGCPSGATGYAVYEGTLGAFTTHAILGGACGIAGQSLAAQTPCAGDCYYLVSAVDDVVGEEGSLGHSSNGEEIARPVAPCRPAVDLEGCVLAAP